MSRIRVVTDSTADIEPDDANRLGIEVVPLNVHWNGSTYQDKVEITIEEFYRKLREEKGTPKTSQPSAGEFEAAYRELLEDADEIISVHLSGKLSGTLNSAQLAAKNVAANRIMVVDSRTTSYALGMIVNRVASAASEGRSLRECHELALDLVQRAKLFAAVDTLEFLRRGGRIGRAQAFAGNLLAIKLIFEIRDGEVYPIDRVRTRAAVIRRTAEVVSDCGSFAEGAVLYGDDPEPASQLRRLIEDMNPALALSSGRIGPVLGTHTGPGVIGFAGLVAEGQ